MAFCSNCGKRLPDGVNFCEYCGAPVIALQSVPNGDNSQHVLMSGSQDDLRNPFQDISADTSQETAKRSVSPHQDEAAPQITRQMYPESNTPPGRRKKSVTPIILGIIVVLVASWFFLKPSGWSTDDAKAATQAYMDAYFMGDSENLAEYMNGKTEEDLDAEREELRQKIISTTFKSTVPVTQELKTRYADFYLSMMGKARYEVGEASKTKDGFEVPVKVYPITSLAHGDFVLLDMQLNDELTDADLNERFYSRELEQMTELMENPTYGDPQEVIMHITKGGDGYEFSEEDANKIVDHFYTLERHWTKERAKKAVEAVLGAVYKEQYEELAKWAVATKDEIEDAFGVMFAKDTLKSSFRDSTDEMARDMELEGTYEIPDEILENFSVALRALMSETKYEVTAIRGEEDEYIADLQITSIRTDSFESELTRKLEAEAGSISDPEDYLDLVWKLSSEVVLQSAESGEYSEPIHQTLHLKFNNNKSYELDYDELLRLVDINSADQDAENIDDTSSSDGESFSEDADIEPEDSSVSDSERKTYSSGKDIPFLVKGTKVVLGETTVQEFLDKTGLTIDDSGDTVKFEDYEEIEIETGDDDTLLHLV